MVLWDLGGEESNITAFPARKGLQFLQIFYRFSGRSPMPVYDYLCNNCQKEFEKVLSLNQHDHDEIRCPHCGKRVTVLRAE